MNPISIRTMKKLVFSISGITQNVLLKAILSIRGIVIWKRCKVYGAMLSFHKQLQSRKCKLLYSSIPEKLGRVTLTGWSLMIWHKLHNIKFWILKSAHYCAFHVNKTKFSFRTITELKGTTAGGEITGVNQVASYLSKCNCAITRLIPLPSMVYWMS